MLVACIERCVCVKTCFNPFSVRDDFCYGPCFQDATRHRSSIVQIILHGLLKIYFAFVKLLHLIARLTDFFFLFQI